jgi:hypothetical protein
MKLSENSISRVDVSAFSIPSDGPECETRTRRKSGWLLPLSGLCWHFAGLTQ